MQCDGYAAYKTLVDPAKRAELRGRITLAFCWSHLRRRFVEIEREGAGADGEGGAASASPSSMPSSAGLRGRSADERCAGRQAHSKPLVLALKAWFEAAADHPLRQEPDRRGDPLRACNHWEGLTRFLDDGRIEMDTNAVERAMRPICLNRKNALFAGCDEGAEDWACIASLIETCRLNAVDPEAWLADVLEKLVGGWPMAGDRRTACPGHPAFRSMLPRSKSAPRHEPQHDRSPAQGDPQ